MSSNGESITGHPYENEYMVALHMMASSSGDGSRKIGMVKEFVDSDASKSFFPAERKRIAEAEAEAKGKAKRKLRTNGNGNGYGFGYGR